MISTSLMNNNQMKGHIVSTNEGLQYSKVHLGLDCDIYIEMVNEEIIRRVGSDVDLTIQPEYIIILDGESYDDYYGMLFKNAQLYLGKEMDIESILSHYLSKRKLDIVEMDDIEYMYNTLGIGYDKWVLMYDIYNVSKHRLVLPIDETYINVLEVLLHHHSNRSW